MTNEPDDKTVDRSRLRLLGLLAAAGASGACTHDPTGVVAPDFATSPPSQNRPKKPVQAEPAGGEGGGGEHGD